MGVTSCCLKYTLNTLNTINGLVGLLFIALATVSFSQAPLTYIIYLYVIGGILFVASLIGCCGICQEHVCLTTTYAAILLGILVVELLGKFGLSFDENAIRKFAANSVQEKWNEELLTPGAMNTTQSTYHCCGRNGPDDYMTIGRTILPASCYPDNKVSNQPHYTKGCIQAAADKFLIVYSYTNGSEWISIGITALMCFGAFYLVGRFRRQHIRYHY